MFCILRTSQRSREKNHALDTKMLPHGSFLLVFNDKRWVQTCFSCVSLPFLTSAPDFSAHQRGGLWGQREGERIVRNWYYAWSYKITQCKIIQGTCAYLGCSTEEKTLLHYSLYSMSALEAYKNTHNYEKWFNPPLEDCNVRKQKTH